MAATGRQRNIEVTTECGGTKLEFCSEHGAIANVYEGHRSYMEGNDPFGVEEWKYYEFAKGQPKLCQTHGKAKSGTGVARGISMWQPHCFPNTLLDKRNGSKVKCKLLRGADGLPRQFNVLLDRTYNASIGGSNVEFFHYLLTPSGQFEENVINAARHNLNAVDCVFEAGSGPHNLDAIDFEDCERAVGPMYAAQRALKDLVNDPSNSVSDRCDAFVLYAWLGSLEVTIDELVDLSPWASEFILEGMKKYGQSPSTDSNYLLNFGDAVESLKYQLERYYAERRVAVLRRPCTISDEHMIIYRKVLTHVKIFAKSEKNCLDSLVVKFERSYDEIWAEIYKTQVGDMLRKRNVSVTTSRKERGSIILIFRVEPISSATFNGLVGDVEQNCPDACGIGIANAGGEDILREETNEYDINFGKWVNLHSRVAPVIVRDTVSKTALTQAVYCQSLTKRGLCCKNKTKDPSRRCWRHRG